MLQDTYRRYIRECRRDSETKPKTRQERQSVAASRGHEEPLPFESELKKSLLECKTIIYANFNWMEIVGAHQYRMGTGNSVDSGMIKSDF